MVRVAAERPAVVGAEVEAAPARPTAVGVAAGGGGGGGRGAPPPESYPEYSGPSGPSGEKDDFDDDIPF